MRIKRFAIAGYAAALLVASALVVVYGAMEVSSTPVFCGTCHVMEPYYESWATSSHGQVACVDCHIPPGITAEFRKKYEALSMVARYFTATYGTNPWAEVEDGACLECHERRLLAGRELFGDVVFDHGPHLAELRRGKRLQCTSCHSQIVQGSHITVTSTSCILCHFKNQPPGSATAQCTLCHPTPSGIVDAEGVQFDHGQVTRFGMACEACHTPPAATAGGVPRERCLTCHNDPERLERYGDGDLLHQAHVTERKVECTDCHLEIDHPSPRHLETAQSECQACHGGLHSPQRQLYAGLGGRGVPPRPDVMFAAGVRCEGCHQAHAGEAAAKADETSCMSCHGPSYRGLFHAAGTALGERTKALGRQIASTRRALGEGHPALEDATANLTLVERGRGIHNVAYSAVVLATAHAQMNEARSGAGLAALALPWARAPYESACLECHLGAESATGRAFGRRFPHRPHVVGQGLECERCHSSHEAREETGAAALLLEATACGECHHAGRRDCTDCHAAVLEQTFSVDLGEFDHALHVEDMELACDTCHGGPRRPLRSPAATVCADCH